MQQHIRSSPFVPQWPGGSDILVRRGASSCDLWSLAKHYVCVCVRLPLSQEGDTPAALMYLLRSPRE